MLEDHSNIFSYFIDVSALVHNILTIDDDRSAGSFLEAVEASEKCGFTGTRGTYDAQYFTFIHISADVFENLEIAEALF